MKLHTRFDIDPELQNRAIVAALTSGLVVDAADTLKLERELLAFKSGLLRVEFGPIKALDSNWIPIATETSPPGARESRYVLYTAEGLAEIIENYSDDIPVVNAGIEEFGVPIFTLAIAYTWTLEDLWREDLGQSGVRIRQELPRDARLAHARRINEILLEGVPEVSVAGLFNHANVPITTVANGSWDLAGTTPQEILADLKEIEEAIIQATLENHYPDTLLLPPELVPRVTQPLGSGSDTSVWDLFRQQSSIEEVTGQVWRRDRSSRLSTAAAGGGPRVVMYKATQEILEADIPLEFLELMPRDKNLQTIVPTVSRTAALQVKRPIGITYVDNAHS